jgi:hypothetical protein
VQTLTATFTPANATNYSPATVTTKIAVNVPVASLSATSFAFGTQAYGSYTNLQTLTMSNSGAATMNIGNIELTGTYASSYLMSHNCPVTLAVGASCTIRLRFYPQIGITPALAVVPASLAITDNALNSPQNVSLTGAP